MKIQRLGCAWGMKHNLFDRSLVRNQSSVAISIFHPQPRGARRSDYVWAEVVNNSINSPALWLICRIVCMFAHMSFVARRVCSPAERADGKREVGRRVSTFSLLDLSPLCALGTSSRIPWGNLEMARLALPNFLSRRFLCAPPAPILELELTPKRHRRGCCVFSSHLSILPVSLVGKTGRRRAGADLYQNRWREMQGM